MEDTNIISLFKIKNWCNASVHCKQLLQETDMSGDLCFTILFDSGWIIIKLFNLLLLPEMFTLPFGFWVVV